MTVTSLAAQQVAGEGAGRRTGGGAGEGGAGEREGGERQEEGRRGAGGGEGGEGAGGHFFIFLIFDIYTSQYMLPFSLNPAKIHKMKSVANFYYSEIYTAIFQNESVDTETEPSYSFDAELDDELIRKALSSPLFTQEREESANLRQTYHSHEESLLPAHFFTGKSTGRPVYHLAKNDYSFDALQTNCFGINIKL